MLLGKYVIIMCIIYSDVVTYELKDLRTCTLKNSFNHLYNSFAAVGRHKIRKASLHRSRSVSYGSKSVSGQ